MMRPAGLLLALGSAGVVLTSIFYLLSPPHAAAPVIPPNLQAALEGAVSGAATMRGAGLSGVPGDMLIAAAGLSIGLGEALRGRGLATLGWFLVALSTMIFAIVDALVGFVLPPTAASAPEAFPGAKYLFDILFIAGTFTFGIGAILALWPRRRDPEIRLPRFLLFPAIIFGAVAAFGGIAGGLGANTYQVMGLGILGGALVFTLIGVSIARFGEI
ncbi:MAG: hypothetical protein AB7I79_21745 [Rhizobiaceae bacterium]